MRRRSFLGACGALLPTALLSQPPDVKRVLVLFKCHFDAGFIDTQANVIRRYFERHFPLAIQTAADLRQRGPDRYVWTTGSWLLYRYLEEASPADRKKMEQ